MYIQEITLEFSPDLDQELLLDEFNWLMSSYHKSGQVANGGYTQFIHGNKIIAMPYTVEKDSLNPKYNNSHVNKQLKRLEALCENVPHYKTIGTDVGKKHDVCTCKRPSALFLSAVSFSRDSALSCGDCKLSLPLYRIPKTDDDTYTSILNWQLNCQIADGIDLINLKNDEIPNFPKPMITAIDQLGFRVCSEIEQLTGIKTRLFQVQSKEKTPRKSRKPASGQKL